MTRVLSPIEKETVITFNQAETTAHIHTHMRKVMTKLRKNPAVTIIEEGMWGSNAWGEYEIPAELVSFRTISMAGRPKKVKPQFGSK